MGVTGPRSFPLRFGFCWPSDEFVYDGEHDLYRMADGEIAFSREYANERRLREEGFIG